MKNVNPAWLVLAIVFFVIDFNDSFMFTMLGFIFLILAFTETDEKK
ncbi:hypothetical protein JZO70_17865 [Enterococcus sp. 669A]|uniref:Uncharacterized protein n=1 Tax=Candidatus Enterococcus moelleringii TaxID=2815325 RepID=A0ABS3LEI6_9ENTE|nr:hypothetical protein [Enterococcus sp. 669A]MBO1308047.1 hypothetical protein [Enterococcus sp. 669A]